MSDFPTLGQHPGQIVISSLGSIGCELNYATGGAVTRTSTAWAVSSTAYFVPFIVTQPLTVVKMFIENGTAVSGNVDVGIYTGEGTKVVTKGSTAQSGTSAHQTLDITDTLLNPGFYYMAMVIDNTTGTNARTTSSTLSTARASGLLEMTAAFPLPDPVTFAALATNYVPSFGVTGNTTI